MGNPTHFLKNFQKKNLCRVTSPLRVIVPQTLEVLTFWKFVRTVILEVLELSGNRWRVVEGLELEEA